MLQVGKSSTKFYGDRSFTFAAANLWNKLPSKIWHAPSLGVFKSKLKTHLSCSRSISVRTNCILILHAISITVYVCYIFTVYFIYAIYFMYLLCKALWSFSHKALYKFIIIIIIISNNVEHWPLIGNVFECLISGKILWQSFGQILRKFWGYLVCGISTDAWVYTLLLQVTRLFCILCRETWFLNPHPSV